MHPIALLSFLAASASAAALAPRDTPVNTAVIPPTFGVTAGQGKDQVQVGSCTGANNKPIPCNCPPAPNSPEFIQKLTTALNQGFIFSPSQVKLPLTIDQFNNAADTSVNTQMQRATCMIQVLQNFNLTTQGVGCPGVSAPVLSVMQQTGKVTTDTSSVGNSG